MLGNAWEFQNMKLFSFTNGVKKKLFYLTTYSHQCKHLLVTDYNLKDNT